MLCLGWEGRQRTSISGTHTLETGLLFVLSCFISLVWHFTDDRQALLIQRKIHIIGCEPLRRQPHSSCQTNLLPYKIIILMRYLSVSQATGSDIRCYVPNHRLCPYLPETGNIRDSWLPLIGRDWGKIIPAMGIETHSSVLLDWLWDRHPGWREIVNSPNPVVDVLAIN